MNYYRILTKLTKKSFKFFFKKKREKKLTWNHWKVVTNHNYHLQLKLEKNLFFLNMYLCSSYHCAVSLERKPCYKKQLNKISNYRVCAPLILYCLMQKNPTNWICFKTTKTPVDELNCTLFDQLSNNFNGCVSLCIFYYADK